MVFLKTFFLASFFLVFNSNNLVSILDPAEETARRDAQIKFQSLNNQFNLFDTRLSAVEIKLQQLEQLLANRQQAQQLSQFSTQQQTSTPFSSEGYQATGSSSSNFSGQRMPDQYANPATSLGTDVPRPGAKSSLSTKQKLQNFKTAAIRASVLEKVIQKYLYSDQVIRGRLGLTFSGKSQAQLLQEIQADENKPGVKSYDSFYSTAVKELKPGSVQSNIFADPTTATIIYQRLAMNNAFYRDNSYGLPFDKSTPAERETWAKSFVEKQVARILSQMKTTTNTAPSKLAIVSKAATTKQKSSGAAGSRGKPIRPNSAPVSTKTPRQTKSFTL